MIDLLIIISPLPIFIIYAIIKVRIARRKRLVTEGQTPAPAEKPYEPSSTPSPNWFLRGFSSVTQMYLRQQWPTARFGFIFCSWISVWALCGSLFPSTVEWHWLPTHAQRVWFSFNTGATTWATGLPAIFGIFTAIIASVMLVGATGKFMRTRPIPLRTLFWGRILAALATLLLVMGLSIGTGFAAMRICYGPVWQSVPTVAAGTRNLPHALLNLDDDETPAQAAARRLGWLESVSTSRIFISAVTTMLLVFSIFVLIFCLPLLKTNGPAQGVWKWLPMLAGPCVVFLFNTFRHHSNSDFGSSLFYNAPWQASPAWHFLPVPIVLTIALLFVSERLYIRRDV